jgi:hypothetical protein
MYSTRRIKEEGDELNCFEEKKQEEEVDRRGRAFRIRVWSSHVQSCLPEVSLKLLLLLHLQVQCKKNQR